ncbi:unnamed protein product [Tetraodon nigroviridis]|uniref:(spotted green pufferfish) hypothetical protein n=1 Tax=Tetraodon nigroviridis TaxID=99883 RepID=Q4SYU9_TETNG|nr:unnamed protein product [Tetraodon nigroviridis]
MAAPAGGRRRVLAVGAGLPAAGVLVRGQPVRVEERAAQVSRAHAAPPHLRGPGGGAPSPEPRAPSPEPRAPSPEPRARSPEPRAPSPEPGAPSREPGAPSPEPRAPSREPGAPSPQPRARSPEPGARSPEPVPGVSPCACVCPQGPPRRDQEALRQRPGGVRPGAALRLGVEGGHGAPDHSHLTGAPGTPMRRPRSRHRAAAAAHHGNGSPTPGTLA